MRTTTIAVATLAVALATPGCAVINRIDGMGQAKDLAARGASAQARILKIWDTGWTVNQDPVVGMLLEVHPPDRDAYLAETKALVPRLQVPLIQPGNEIPVRYDPEDPTRVSPEYER